MIKLRVGAVTLKGHGTVLTRSAQILPIVSIRRSVIRCPRPRRGVFRRSAGVNQAVIGSVRIQWNREPNVPGQAGQSNVEMVYQ